MKCSVSGTCRAKAERIHTTIIVRLDTEAKMWGTTLPVSKSHDENKGDIKGSKGYEHSRDESFGPSRLPSMS